MRRPRSVISRPENTCGTRAFSSCARRSGSSGWTRWGPRLWGGAGGLLPGAAGARDFLGGGREAFAACPADSIDYAVMEKLAVGDGVVIPFAAGWSDVGAWDALWQIDGKGSDGNVLRGGGMAVNTRGTLAISQSRLVACVGLVDAVVVETPDAGLVAHKSRMQQVKEGGGRVQREG